jgi:hypothetical protein
VGYFWAIGSNRHQLKWGGGATPFPSLDLESRDAVSIPTAPTNFLLVSKGLVGFAHNGYCRILVQIVRELSVFFVLRLQNLRRIPILGKHPKAAPRTFAYVLVHRQFSRETELPQLLFDKPTLNRCPTCSGTESAVQPLS